ncbi:putative nonsense-mediated mrna decay protein, partial [Diplogelasinospora grovesii]
MATPQVLSRNRADGVTASQASSDAPKASSTMKAPAEGDKVVVRRLPPGMTEEEFITILGDAWRVGNGKVDWFSYRQGKISQHPSKPSTPSRAYLHVMKKDDLMALSETVRTAVWEDAKDSYLDPALVGPPAVEFSIYKKVPSTKRRADTRQGTIDQDPEFMAFLEALANPDAHKEATDAEQAAAEEAAKAEKTTVTVTPLIEYLREKKAAKAKEAAAAKSAKQHSRQDSQGGGGKGKTTTQASTEEPKGRKSKETKSERSSEKPPRESVKILTKKAAADAAAAAETAKPAASQTNTQATAQDGTMPKSRRAGIAAAARILQRDLGLSPGNAHRKARQEAAKAEAEAKAKEAPKESATTTTTPAAPPEPARPSTPNGSSAASSPKTPASASGRSRGRRRGEESGKTKGGDGKDGGKLTESPSSPAPTKTPVVLLKKRDEPPQPVATLTPSTSSAPAAAAPPPPAAPTPPTGPKAAATTKKQPSTAGKNKDKDTSSTPGVGATRAFIKHANHTQGVTDATLREAMQVYGAVTAVEMDRKKGFAYVDFANPEGLTKAMAASPVTVAQATVQVLERKETTSVKRGGASKAGSTTEGSGSNAAAPPAAAPTG